MSVSVVSHEDLRKVAVKWLTNSKHCSVVLSEMVSYAGEIPDAIGWKSSGSILIECKISRSDFFRNEHKASHRTGSALGRRRYFLVPSGLVTVEDMERFPQYGLLYYSGTVRMVKDAPLRDADLSGEITMLVSALRRVRTREFLTINVLPEDSTHPTPARKYPVTSPEPGAPK